MSTFLFDKTIFGPVRSRRLGNSLGINLLPVTSKLCNFNCIYCECGWNTDAATMGILPSAAEVRRQLEARLNQMQANAEPLDVITFAGNGEPTMHPEFLTIVNDTIALRNRLFPEVKIAVLSNATLLFKADIRKALQRIDMNILKLDSAIESTHQLLNKPATNLSVEALVKNLQLFNHKLIVQTMFVQGHANGIEIDNTTDGEINAWLTALKSIVPQQVMLYTIARDTPTEGLRKVGVTKLYDIAARVEQLGISVLISA